MRFPGSSSCDMKPPLVSVILLKSYSTYFWNLRAGRMEVSLLEEADEPLLGLPRASRTVDGTAVGAGRF